MDYSPVDQGFEEILEAIILDLFNQDPDIDVSKGSLEFIRAGALGGVEWGLKQDIKFALRQVHPDTASPQGIERHAADYAIAREPGESIDSLLEKVRNREQKPPAGGNSNDYRNWALEAHSNVADAKVYPIIQGVGTVGILVISDKNATGSEIPDEALKTAVREHILTKEQPVFREDGLSVFGPFPRPEDVTMTVTGVNADRARIKSDIEAYMNAMKPDETLYLSHLYYIAVGNGAEDISITTPAADIVPLAYEMIRPGVINVT